MKKTKTVLLGTSVLVTMYACRSNDPAPVEESILPAVNMFTGSYATNTGVMNYFISKDSANKMIQSYLGSIPATAQNTQLNALIFDADALRNYLSDTSIKKVKFILAHTLEYINSGNAGQNAGYKSGALTLIAAGYNAQGNYVFGPDFSVPDRAVPCPTECPSAGTASNSLLE